MRLPSRSPTRDLHFPDIHNGTISTRFLLTISNRRPTPRLVLASGPVGPRDATILNGVFEEWAVEIGVPPWFAVENGEVRDLHRPDVVDFVISAQEADVVSGFYAWVQPTRWMGRRGIVRAVLSGPKLRVEFACPVDALAAARPPVSVPVLDVALENADGGETVPLGAIRPDGSAWRAYDLAVPGTSGPGAVACPSASSSRRAQRGALPTYFRAPATPGTLSVEVFRIGFVKELPE